MPFPFTCPMCRQTSQVPDRLVGAQAKCPSCGFEVGIPTVAGKRSPLPDPIPVVSGDDIPVVSPIAPPVKTSGGAIVAVVLLLGAAVAVSCCGGVGLLGLWWISGDSGDANPTQQTQMADATGLDPPRPNAPAGPITLAPDDDSQPPAYWVRRLRDADEQRVEQARKRLIGMGIKAVPDLRRASRDTDVTLRLAAIGVLGEIGENAVDAWNDIAVSLAEPDAALRIAAAAALGRLGRGAYPCLPMLVRAGTDPNPNVRAAAIDSLGKIGWHSKEDVPKLLPLWQETSPEKRAIHADLIRMLNPDPESAASLFAPLLSDRYKKIRLTAVQALADAGEPIHAQVFSRTLPLLDDSDAEVRKAALAALGKLGPVQPADRPGLEAGLRGKSVEIRVYCLESLGGLGNDALPSIPLIARRLSDADATVRLAAAKALGRFGKAAAEVVEVLLTARRDSDPAVRLEAIKDLGNLIREQGVLQALFDSLNEPNPAIHEAVARSIRAAQPPLGKNELPILAANLKNLKPEARRLAASELARIGAGAEPILGDLLQALKDSDPTVRRHICTAIAALGPKANQAEPILTDALTAILKDEAREPGSLELYREATNAVAKIEKPDVAVPFWSAGLKSKNRLLRKEAMQALSAIGEPARGALPELCNLVSDRELGQTAGETIVRLGGPEAVKELARLVDNGPAPARLIAIRMLGKIGPDAKPALGALYRAANYYKGKEAGNAAREAIRAINKK